MKRFPPRSVNAVALRRALVLMAFICVCLGWYGSERRNASLKQAHWNRLRSKQHVDHIRLAKITGTQITDHPIILDLSVKQQLDSNEFRTIYDRISKRRAKIASDGRTDSLEEVRNLMSRIKGKVIQLYSIDLNCPDNPNGDEMFYVFVHDGEVVLSFRQVDPQ